MSNIEWLRAERLKEGRTMSEIADKARGRSMTPEEQVDFDESSARIDHLDKKIAATGQGAAPPPPTAADHTKALQVYAREQAGLPPADAPSGADVTRANMLKLIGSGAAGPVGAARDTSAGSPVAKSSMAKLLRNARAM